MIGKRTRHRQPARMIPAATLACGALMLMGCATQASAPGGGEPGARTPTIDPREDLATSLLTVEEYPVAGWSELDTRLLPADESSLPESPGVSTGTAAPSASPTTLCGNGDVELIEVLDEAEGVRRSFGASGGLVEALFMDEDGALADDVTGQLQDCIDAGPVVTEADGITFSHAWTTEGLPQTDGVLSARFSSSGDDPLNVTALSIGHVDGVTMVVFSKIKALRVVLEPDEYGAVVAAAYDKLAATRG